MANCTALREADFNAVGYINPFLDEREEEPFFASHVAYMSRAVKTVRRVREALGDEVDMLLELRRRLTPAEAIDFIPRASSATCPTGAKTRSGRRTRTP